MKKKIRKSSSDGNYDTMYIGMDLHKDFLQIAIMDNNGKVLKNSRIENNHKQVSNFFKNVKPDNTKVVMESSSVWYNIYRYLTEEKKLDVVLSNPIKTKAIASAKIKTDKIDARVHLVDSIIAHESEIEDHTHPKKHQFLLGERSQIRL